MILGWSRFRAGCFLPCQDLEHFLLGHKRAFEQIGGIPQTILYDNLKSVVLLRKLKLSDSRMNLRFLDFAGHYGFLPRLHLPGRPQTKGRWRTRSAMFGATSSVAAGSGMMWT